MGEFYYKGQNITQVAEVVSNDIVTPTSAFFENWIKYFHADKISISGNSFSFTGAGGWEIVGCKLGCVPNTTNTIRFDVVSATINGGALRAGVRTTPPDIDGDVSFISYYDITSTGEVTITFNPGNSNIIYLVFNGGYLNDGTTHYFTFDFSKIHLGMVRSSGITDSNMHLVSTNTTAIGPANEDAFEGRLQINGVVQKYCKLGLAPLGNLLREITSPGTYYFHYKSSGEVTLENSSQSTMITLSTAAQKRKLFTFVLQGAGGGGSSGQQGNLFSGGNNGQGGGGGGVACAMIDFRNAPTGRYRIEIGAGGSGGTSNNTNGAQGGDTQMFTPNGTRIIGAWCGGYGTRDGGGWGGNYNFYDVSGINYVARNGASGGAGAGSDRTYGDNTSAFNAFAYSITGQNLYISGHLGGGSGSDDIGGGGGASHFGNGGSPESGTSTSKKDGGIGAGGAGGDANNVDWWRGGHGGNGLFQVYY